MNKCVNKFECNELCAYFEYRFALIEKESSRKMMLKIVSTYFWVHVKAIF